MPASACAPKRDRSACACNQRAQEDAPCKPPLTHSPPPSHTLATTRCGLTQPKAGAMLCDLVARAAQAVKQEGAHVAAVVCVDEAERVERPALAVRAAVGVVARQVGRHERAPLLQVAAVDHAQPGRRRKLCAWGACGCGDE
eukprot:237396-Chlamydomonas_euryale.AAC.8